MKKAITPIIGAHVSIAGGLHKAPERAAALGANTMQIFTKSSRSWFEKPITEENAKLFKQSVKDAGLKKIVAHTSYLINIASAKPETEKNAVAALKHELHRCEKLGIEFLVLHPGSHVGQGEEVGIKKISKNLDRVLKTGNGETKILLEAMAGQGTNLGYTFKQIREIIDGCEYKKLLGVCLDTCHIFSAGYELTSAEGYEKVMKRFARIVGMRRLNAIHINDSKTPLGGRKDRHESIGKGKIPIKIFMLIMQDKRLSRVPKILETPDPELYAKEIALLKKWSMQKLDT